jgi:hypothetical protein
MNTSIDELIKLEEKLRERLASEVDSRHSTEVDSGPLPKDRVPRTIHSSTRGQWQSQLMGGIPTPRRRR